MTVIATFDVITVAVATQAAGGAGLAVSCILLLISDLLVGVRWGRSGSH